MSQKQFVIERMAKLESGEIQPVRRGPGRPRGENYGKPWTSKANSNDPVSMARSLAGQKGRAVNQSKLQTEASRKKFGRIKQEAFDAEVAALKEELKTYDYAPGLDKQDTQEFSEWCIEIIEDCIWKRKWIDTHGRRDIVDEEIERSKEDRQYTTAYPELRIGDLLAYATEVLSPERTGLKNLVVRAFEEFIKWAPTQTHADEEFKRAIPQAEKALPKLQAGSIFKAHLLPEDDPRLIIPEPPRPIEEIRAEYRQWELQGREADGMLSRAESLQEAKLRQERELEQAILEQKAEDSRRAMEQQQRALLGQQWDDIQQRLHGDDPDIFGSRPTRN